jgi:hypothetical protein
MAAAASPERVFVSGYQGLVYHEKWKRAYGKKLITQVKTIPNLEKGDIIIFNEGMACEHFGSVPEGVFVYVYLLAAYRGCKKDGLHYIAHNHFLLNFETLRMTKERLVHPYLNENFTQMAHQRGLLHDGALLYSKMRHRGKKRNLILVDDDVPESVKRIFKHVAESLGGESLVLTGLKHDELLEAYESAKMVTDWCMRGSERCVLEASLFGALVTVNNCDVAKDFYDLPIPAKFVFNHTDNTGKNSDKTNEDLYNTDLPIYKKLKADIYEVVLSGFTNYWDHVDDFEPMRRAVLSFTPNNMIKESVRLLSTHNLSPDEMAQVSLKKCEGC